VTHEAGRTATATTCNTELRSLETDDIDGLCFICPAGAKTRNCQTLPAQPRPHIANAPFGCSDSGPATKNRGVALLGLLAVAPGARRDGLRSGRLQFGAPH
jgi:hypothetical protein